MEFILSIQAHVRTVVLVFAIFQISGFLQIEGSLLTCACNTQECRSQGTNRCVATNMCFVQYNPSASGRRSKNAKNEPIRGCINRSTPLLCENRPPALMGLLQQAWPVLHCCSSDMCNKNVLPTPPPWFTVTPQPKKDNSNEAFALERFPPPPPQEWFSGTTPPTFVATQEDVDVVVPAKPQLTAISSPVDPDSWETAAESENAVVKTYRFPKADEEQNEVAEDADTDGSPLLLYIAIPAVAVVLLMIIISAAVMALRRNQFVSTEDLVVEAPSTNSCGRPHHKGLPSQISSKNHLKITNSPAAHFIARHNNTVANHCSNGQHFFTFEAQHI